MRKLPSGKQNKAVAAAPGMVALLVLTSALAGCSGSQGGAAAPEAPKDKPAAIDTTPVEINIYSNFAETAVDFEDIFVKPVKAKYPFITPKLTVPNANTTLEGLITAGQIPDMIILSGLNLFTTLDLGVMSDLSPLIKKNNLDLNRFEPAYLDLVKAYSSKGEIFALPYTANFNALFYNKDIFDKFGVSYPKDDMLWDDVIELSKKVSRTADGINFRGIDPENLPRLVGGWSLPFTDPKTEQANFDSWKPAFDLLQKVIAVPGNAPEKVIRFDKAFQEQKTVAMRATTNMIKELQSAADKGSPVNWDMVTYPKVDAKQNHFGVAGARAIMITPNSKVKEQAFKVIETLLSNEVQVTQNKLGVMTPLASQDVQKTFGTGIEFLKGKNLQAAYKLKPGFRVITRYDNIAGNTAFDNSLKLYTGADVNTVIRQANEELNKKIAEEKAKKK